MNPRDRDSLARKLREQRASLVREVGVAEADLESLADSRDNELEERAQEDRLRRLLSRLDVRARMEVEEIDAALDRIADGTFGRCSRCGEGIPLPRLRALPTARHCVACARALEARSSDDGEAVEEEAGRSGPVPGELAHLGERDKERAVWRMVLEDGRVDCDELRLVCRHGVVYLGGAVSSEPEHRVLLKLVTEVAGFTEVVDHLRVNPMFWEREGKPDGAAPARSNGFEPEDPENEDVVLSIEEGIEWAPPAEPPPDEE
jgi:RNA polymerase-binding transcription factor